MNTIQKRRRGCGNSSGADTLQMELWMSETYARLVPMNFRDSLRSICSPELEAGLTPCVSLDGQMANLSGPDHVLVSHSLLRDKEKELQTNGTFGRRCDGSLRGASLQQSLENRLRVRLDCHGSRKYALTWKHWAMRSGEPICALRASAHRTSDNEFTGWLWMTPEARMYRDLSSKEIIYAASRASHSLSTVLQAYIRGFKHTQIPHLLSILMGYPDQWVLCADLVMQSSRNSRRNSSKPIVKQ